MSNINNETNYIKNIDDFSIKHILRIYDYYEIYQDKYSTFDKNNEYYYKYEKVYGFGMKKYQNKIVTIKNINNKDESNKYLVACELLTNNDELIQYCQCEYHKLYWFNFAKATKYNSGCLESDNKRQDIIYETRLYLLNKKKMIYKNNEI